MPSDARRRNALETEATPPPQPIDVHAILAYLAAVCEQYERTAPAVHAWARDLAERINERPSLVTLAELWNAARLTADGSYLQPNSAARLVSHVMERLRLNLVDRSFRE